MPNEDTVGPFRCIVCGEEVQLDAGHYRILDVRVHPGCIRSFWRPPSKQRPREIGGGSARFRSPSFEAAVQTRADFRARCAATRARCIATRAASRTLAARSARAIGEWRQTLRLT